MPHSKRHGVEHTHRNAKRLGLAVLVPLAMLLPAAAPKSAAEELTPLDIKIGRALFRRNWVPAPSSAAANDGLGPHFDARSCEACHKRAGRGLAHDPATATSPGRGTVVRLAMPDGQPDPRYGRQLQPRSLPGVQGEPHALIRSQDQSIQFGASPAPTFPVRRWIVTPTGDGRERLALDTSVTLRLAPDLALSALIESADLDRAAGNRNSRGPGRFGWKAEQATLEQQIASAFALDLGLSASPTAAPWGDCTALQTDCLNASHGARAGEPEIAPVIVERIAAYLRSLAPSPPATPNLSGRASFEKAHCVTCHVPVVPAKDGGGVSLYSDLQLHDLGPGLAADRVPGEGGASPNEWRTAPLRLVGRSLQSHGGLLHDGRALSIDEAVAWHDGVGAESRKRYFELSDQERQSLVTFLKDLR